MEQWLVRYFQLQHITMPVLLLPRKLWMIMIYELLNFMNNWFSLMKFVIKSNPSTSMYYINSSLASKWPGLTGSEKTWPSQYHSRIWHRIGKMKIKTNNKEWINIVDHWINQRNQKVNNKYLWWMMKFKQIILKISNKSVDL